MWTAPTPASTWSAEQSVLGWNTSPSALAPKQNINTIGALSNCLAVSEGSATTYRGALDFVFACSDGTTQKIILLRATDHISATNTNSFQYVATLLQASDAATFNGTYFSAPALVPTETGAPLLIATPVATRSISGSNLEAYSGCVFFPIADEENGTLFRSGSTPLAILQIPPFANHLNGACSWERGIVNIGILMNDATSNPDQFTILNTRKDL